MSPIDELVKAAEKWIAKKHEHGCMGDDLPLMLACEAHIPAAKLYAERIEFLEAALRESTYYIPEDGVCSRTHPAYYRWLGEEENAEVGDDALKEVD